jgi:hypothetical protein
MQTTKEISLGLTYLVVFGSVLSLHSLAYNFYLIVFSLVILFGVINDFKFKSYPPRAALTILGFLFSIYFLLDLTFENLIAPFANILLVLIAIKSLEDKKPRDIYQMLLLSWFGIALSATFRFDISFLAFFLYELILGSIAFLFTNLYSSLGNTRLTKEFIDRYLRFSLLFPIVVFVVAIPFFISLPRTHTPLFDIAQSSRQTLTSGIAETVELGKVGEIQRDNTVVMRVYGDVPEKPYWRVAVFDSLVGTSWIKSSSVRETTISLKGKGRRFKYEIILSPTFDNYIPALDYPVSIIKAKGYRGRIKRVYGGYFHGTKTISKPIRYEAISTSQKPAEPPSKIHLRVPKTIPRSIWELAKTLSKGKETDIEKVEAVKSFFKEGFRYTLKLSNFEGHPIEHFLFRAKAGNCEFFASSTALLLRMMGIPTRLVGGFKGFIKNNFGNYLIVTNSMAHVWVEAYVDGHWIRIDTTPPYVAPALRKISTLDLIRDTLVSFWFDNVIDYTAHKQTNLLRKASFTLQNITRLEIKGVFKAVIEWVVIIAVCVIVIYLYISQIRKTPKNLYKKLIRKLEKESTVNLENELPEKILILFRSHKNYKEIEFIVRLYQKYRFSKESISTAEINEGYRILRNIY